MSKTKAIKGNRKHHRFSVIVTCTNDEEFGRVYNNGEKAEKFASRQKNRPS